MSLYNMFEMSVQLVTFSGTITYNENGFAVLPPYSVCWIPASMQPIKRGALRFLPQGTHYAGYMQIITDYPIYDDWETANTLTLGNYIVYGIGQYKAWGCPSIKTKVVWKIISDQDFLPFVQLTVNHVETYAAKDNRLYWDDLTQTLNLPLPEIPGAYAPLFELIHMASSCFTSPSFTPLFSSPTSTLPVLWAFQQELAPLFPYCTVTIEKVENIENTNHNYLYLPNQTQYNSISQQLIVKFSFIAQDQVQCLNLMQQFKMNHGSYVFSTEKFAFIGFLDETNDIDKEFYEDRTTFIGTVRMRFSWISEQYEHDTNTIETVAFQLSIPPLMEGGHT